MRSLNLFRRVLLAAFCFTASALIAAIVAPALPDQLPPVVGVTLVNEPYKQIVLEQEATFQALQAAGVNVIRAGIWDNDQGLAFAQRAWAYGIKIEWLLGVPPDPGTPWPKLPDTYNGKTLWRGYPLSTANAEVFKATIGAQLAKLESKGIAFAGFELGNEINWMGFNADIPLPAQGKVLTEKDLTSDPEGRKIAQGDLRYLQTLAGLKDIRDQSTLNRRTPIISAGLADLDDSGKWLHTVRADAVSVDATLHFLQANGLDRLVDGYGLHFYPVAANPGTAQGQWFDRVSATGRGEGKAVLGHGMELQRPQGPGRLPDRRFRPRRHGWRDARRVA